MNSKRTRILLQSNSGRFEESFRFIAFDPLEHTEESSILSEGDLALRGDVADIERENSGESAAYSCSMLDDSSDTEAGETGDRPIASGGVRVAELACDADWEFVERAGGVDEAIDQIAALIHSVNVPFVRDVGIRHHISTIVIRTRSQHSYDSSDAEILLEQLAAEWNSTMSEIERDMVLLLSGKSLHASTLGAARRFGICNENAFALATPFRLGRHSCRSDLIAHELGHNWGASHCDCNGWTMNSTLSCGNAFHPSLSIPDILSYRNSRDCLDVESFSIIIEAPSRVWEDEHATVRAIHLDPDGLAHAISEVNWSVIPSTAGSVSGGEFRPASVATDVAANITAVILADGVEHEASTRIVVMDRGDAHPGRIVLRLEAANSAEDIDESDGDEFEVDVFASAGREGVDDVRSLQFDFGGSTGVELQSVDWTFDGLLDPNAYATRRRGALASATYLFQSPLPGLILNLGAHEQRIAKARFRRRWEGVVRLIRKDDAPSDSTVIRAGFSRVRLFDATRGNLSIDELPFAVTPRLARIVSSEPPIHAIDARQPWYGRSRLAAGWSKFQLAFDRSASGCCAMGIRLTQSDGAAPPPMASCTEKGSSVVVTLQRPMTPGAWVMLESPFAIGTARWGYFPGDVDADGAADASDLLALIDQLNGTSPASQIWSCDIDRSERVEPKDIVRLIDLLNNNTFGSALPK